MKFWQEIWIPLDMCIYATLNSKYTPKNVSFEISISNQNMKIAFMECSPCI